MTSTELRAILTRVARDGSYSAYLAAENALREAGPVGTGAPPLRVAVLRNFTVDPLLPVIAGEIALAGYHPLLFRGGYDSIVTEVLDPASDLYRFQPDFVIVAQWLETLSPVLATRFLSLSPEEIQAEKLRVVAATAQIIEAVRRHSAAPILINNHPLPAHPTLGILDAQSRNYQTHTILTLNAELLEQATRWPDVYIVDYMSAVAVAGSQQAFDERHWHIARAPLGRKILVPLGREYGRFFRVLRGNIRKCLVLDCDNTLWGGIIGEDGIGGIQIGSTYPGSCYQAFQREILNLHDRGVLLALCSKNNEADVLQVLRTHPDMLLREEHFAAWQINWDDKATNMERLAQALNIGLDSLVLADDSSFECGLLRERLPQVGVLELDGEPSTYRARLAASSYFDSLTFSAEDRRRTRMYRDERQRKEVRAAVGSVEEYLTTLDVVATIGAVDEVSIPRVAQLTQKSNQFNLTTRRYTEGDIAAFARDAESAVFCLKVRDRISDLGLVGVAIVKYADDSAEIDSFLLSCRALGRGAEQSLLAHVSACAAAKGCVRLLGRFRATEKNGQVAGFYSNHGFHVLSEDPEGSLWELPLPAVLAAPGWIRVEVIPLAKESCAS